MALKRMDNVGIVVEDLEATIALNGLFGASQPLPPGRRNQVELGVQPAHS